MIMVLMVMVICQKTPKIDLGFTKVLFFQEIVNLIYIYINFDNPRTVYRV